MKVRPDQDDVSKCAKTWVGSKRLPTPSDSAFDEGTGVSFQNGGKKMNILIYSIIIALALKLKALARQSTPKIEGPSEVDAEKTPSSPSGAAADERFFLAFLACVVLAFVTYALCRSRGYRVSFTLIGGAAVSIALLYPIIILSRRQNNKPEQSSDTARPD